MLNNIFKIFNTKKNKQNNSKDNKMAQKNEVRDPIGHWQKKFNSSESKTVIQVYGWSEITENHVVIGRNPNEKNISEEITIHVEELYGSYEKLYTSYIETPKQKMPKKLLLGLDDVTPVTTTKSWVDKIEDIKPETANHTSVQNSQVYTHHNQGEKIVDESLNFHKKLMENFKIPTQQSYNISVDLKLNYDLNKLRSGIDLLNLDKKEVIRVLLNDVSFCESLVGLLDEPKTEVFQQQKSNSVDVDTKPITGNLTQNVRVNTTIENDERFKVGSTQNEPEINDMVVSLQERINKLNNNTINDGLY